MYCNKFNNVFSNYEARATFVKVRRVFECVTNSSMVDHLIVICIGYLISVSKFKLNLISLQFANKK